MFGCLFFCWFLFHMNSLVQYNYILEENITGLEAENVKDLLTGCISEECKVNQYLKNKNKKFGEFQLKINNKISDSLLLIYDSMIEQIYKNDTVLKKLINEMEMKVHIWYLSCEGCRSKISNFGIYNNNYIDISRDLFMDYHTKQHFTKKNLNESRLLSEKGLLIYNISAIIHKFLIETSKTDIKYTFSENIISLNKFSTEFHDDKLEMSEKLKKEINQYEIYYNLIKKTSLFYVSDLMDMILKHEKYCDFLTGEFPFFVKLFAETIFNDIHTYQDIINIIFCFQTIDLCSYYFSEYCNKNVNNQKDRVKSYSIKNLIKEKKRTDYSLLVLENLIRHSLTKIMKIVEKDPMKCGISTRYINYKNELDRGNDDLSFINFVDFIFAGRENDREFFPKRRNEIFQSFKEPDIHISLNTSLTILDNFIFYLNYCCTKYDFGDDFLFLFEIFEKLKALVNRILVDRSSFVNEIDEFLQILTHKILSP